MQSIAAIHGGNKESPAIFNNLWACLRGSDAEALATSTLLALQKTQRTTFHQATSLGLALFATRSTLLSGCLDSGRDDI